MAWIESHTPLIRHRKLVTFAKALRMKPAHVMGHLHAMWHTALEQQEDGDLSSWSDDLIAEASAFTGDSAHYVRLLREHGWLDGALIHDWLDYAGRYLIRKYGSSNKLRLKEIWRKHGRDYSVSLKRPDSDTKVTLPTYQPTNLPTNGGGRLGEAFRQKGKKQ